MSRFHVRYSVEGFGIREQGPYGAILEADEQAHDINGFDGVKVLGIREIPENGEPVIHTWPLRFGRLEKTTSSETPSSQ